MKCLLGHVHIGCAACVLGLRHRWYAEDDVCIMSCTPSACVVTWSLSVQLTMTALHEAAMLGRTDTVKFLMSQFNADLEARDGVSATRALLLIHTYIAQFDLGYQCCVYYCACVN